MHTRTWFQLICQSLHMCATLSTTRHTIRMHAANYTYVRTCKTQHGAKCFPCTHVPLHSTACCHRHMRKATSDIMLAYVIAKQQWRQAQLLNAFFTRKTNQNKTWPSILSRFFVVRVQQDTFCVVDLDLPDHLLQTTRLHELWLGVVIRGEPKVLLENQKQRVRLPPLIVDERQADVLDIYQDSNIPNQPTSYPNIQETHARMHKWVAAGSTQ